MDAQTKGLSLKKATSADASILLDMMVDFNRIEEIDWSRESGERALCTLLANDSLGWVGVFLEGMAACGYSVLTWGYDLEWNGRDAFLTELYLRPAHRGKGHARELLAQIEIVAREHGSHALHLMVRPDNVAARHLYERSGYTSPGRIFLTKKVV